MSREEWETLLLLRGAIVASFGQVETILAELALRLSHDQRCAALRETYPHSIDKRLVFLRACFKIEPYKRRAGLAALIFKQFEISSGLRHVMAHGRIINAALGWLKFRDFKPSTGGAILMRDQRYTIYDLEDYAYSAARLARRVQSLAAKADAEDWLPTL